MPRFRWSDEKAAQGGFSLEHRHDQRGGVRQGARFEGAGSAEDLPVVHRKNSRSMAMVKPHLVRQAPVAGEFRQQCHAVDAPGSRWLIGRERAINW